MIRTVTTIAITVIVVLFGMQNFDHVPIYFFLGKAVHIRLVFVIAISGVIGYLIRSIIGIGREERLKHRLQAILRQQKRRQKQTADIDEELGGPDET